MIEWDDQKANGRDYPHELRRQGAFWSDMRIWPIIKEAVLLPWTRRQHFWPLLALPVALSTLLSLGDYWLGRDASRN
ncbi:MAG: hypothetical protein ABIU05_04230, partial [Nitrospirales bacterium]